MPRPEPNSLFMGGCHDAIKDMRAAGMNDMIIGCVLATVRAAAITEERYRLEALLKAHPPVHLPAQDYAKWIGESYG